MGWDGFIRPWSLTVALGSVNHAEEQGGVTAELRGKGGQDRRSGTGVRGLSQPAGGPGRGGRVRGRGGSHPRRLGPMRGAGENRSLRVGARGRGERGVVVLPSGGRAGGLELRGVAHARAYAEPSTRPRPRNLVHLDERRDLHWRNHLARDLRAGSTTRTEEDAPRARKTLETQKLTRVGACAVSSQKAPEPPPGGRRENGARTRSRRGDVTRRAARDWLRMRSGPGGTCLFPRAGATLPGTDVFGPG